MRSLRHAWDRICSFENLLEAYRKACRGKRDRESVQRFELERESNLLRLRHSLLDGSYTPGPHRTFTILHPKPRLIAAAPFEDRVVQHALCNVTQPFLERSFIADTYACILGRGTHRAVDRYTHFARRHTHVLKMDVKRFFPSIDHAILTELLARHFPEEPVQRLIASILANGRTACEPVTHWVAGDTLLSPLERPHGLPIGNLTSQLWANVYLDKLDHFVTEKLGRGAYVRYMDDFVIFGSDKASLRGVLREVGDWLASERRLLLHETKCHVRGVHEGVTFLGYRVWPTYRRVKRENVVRARRRVAAINARFARGELDVEGAKASLMAWTGHTRHADAREIERLVLGKVSLRRGAEA